MSPMLSLLKLDCADIPSGGFDRLFHLSKNTAWTNESRLHDDNDKSDCSRSITQGGANDLEITMQ